VYDRAPTPAGCSAMRCPNTACPRKSWTGDCLHSAARASSSNSRLNSAKHCNSTSRQDTTSSSSRRHLGGTGARVPGDRRKGLLSSLSFLNETASAKNRPRPEGRRHRRRQTRRLTPARTAKRLGAEVTIVYRGRAGKCRNPDEIEQALDEGVKLITMARAVARHHQLGRQSHGLEARQDHFRQVDARGRRAPVRDQGHLRGSLRHDHQGHRRKTRKAS